MSNDSSDAGKHKPPPQAVKPAFLKRIAKNRHPAGSFGGPPRVILTALAIFLASQFLAALLVSLAFKLTSQDIDITNLAESTFLQFAYIAAAETLVILLAVRIIKNRGLKLSAIGLGRRPKASDLFNALLGIGIFYGLLIVIGILMQLLVPDFRTDQPQSIGFEELRNSLDKILAFMALVFFPPIAEEILARGYLYSGLRASWKFGPALLATSLIFAAAHLPGDSVLVWGAAINTFVLSVVLVYLRERTGALYSSILVHSFNNVIAFIVLML